MIVDNVDDKRSVNMSIKVKVKANQTKHIGYRGPLKPQPFRLKTDMTADSEVLLMHRCHCESTEINIDRPV
jgi:hypothetical protein